MAASKGDDNAEKPAVVARTLRPPAALRSVLRPFTTAGRYYFPALRENRDDTAGLPVARPTIALAAQAFRDEVVLLGLRLRRPLSDPRAF